MNSGTRAKTIRGEQGIDLMYTPHLGNCQAILDLAALRYDEALEGRRDVPREETLLLLVGRGARDVGSTQEMEEYAERRRQQRAAGQIVHCFYAMADPLLEDVLPLLEELWFPRIVVQPHLLFPGLLVQQVRPVVGRFARQSPGREWIVTEPLGPHSLLAEAVFEGLRACGASIGLSEIASAPADLVRPADSR